MNSELYTPIFVCTGNTCRSPIAEMVFKKFFNSPCISAGLRVTNESPINPKARLSLLKFNVPITEFSSKEFHFKHTFDRVVITMTREQQRHILDIYPQLYPKAFTLLEVLYLTKKYGSTSFSDAHKQRRIVTVPSELDIPDPINHPQSVFDDVTKTIHDAIKEIKASDIFVKQL